MSDALRDPHDELLADPPRGNHHLGSLGGYAAGAAQRRVVAISLGAAIIVAIGSAWYWSVVVDERLRAKLPDPAEMAARSRELTWTGGRALLGLGREAPEIEVIHLPDRDIRLANDCDSARIRVEVSDGKTTVIEVLRGEIVETPR